MRPLPIAAFVLAGLLSSTASATIIVENTGGPGSGGSSDFYGQSFTTPSGSSFDSIEFNFFSDVPPTTPVANGTLYLLSSAYSGTPSALSSSTTGYIASSTGVSGGMYVFDVSVTLQPDTQYFVYADTALLPSGGNVFGSEESYKASTSGSSFGTNGGASANFEVTGSAVTDVVPEPTSFLLVLPAIGLLFLKTSSRQR